MHCDRERCRAPSSSSCSSTGSCSCSRCAQRTQSAPAAPWRPPRLWRPHACEALRAHRPRGILQPQLRQSMLLSGALQRDARPAACAARPLIDAAAPRLPCPGMAARLRTAIPLRAAPPRSLGARLRAHAAAAARARAAPGAGQGALRAAHAAAAGAPRAGARARAWALGRSAGLWPPASAPRAAPAPHTRHILFRRRDRPFSERRAPPTTRCSSG